MIRVVCKAPPRESKAGIYTVGSWENVSVTHVADDGKETPIYEVEKIEITLEAGYEPARVRLTLVDVDIEVEAPDGPPVEAPRIDTNITFCACIEDSVPGSTDVIVNPACPRHGDAAGCNYDDPELSGDEGDFCPVHGVGP